MTPTPALQVDDLHAGYGAIEVVSGISLVASTGETVAVLGRNGAGKTTALAAIAGLRHSRGRGRVWVDGHDVSGAPPADVVAAGLALVPEGHRIFPTMTVRENLRLGMFPDRRAGRVTLDRRLAAIFDLFPVLDDFLDRQGGQLSGGQQQMVAIAQALMAEPKVLLLDEPSAGLAPAVVADIYAAIGRLRDGGTAVVVVEQNVERALTHSTRAYLMDRGRITVEGASAEMMSDERIPAAIHGLGA